MTRLNYDRLMNTETPTRALILDYGEVLARFQSAASIKRMADLAGLDTEEFHRRYWLHRPDYDSGRLSARAYWEAAGAPPAAINDLIAADVESWLDYREDVWDIAAKFKATRGLTAILSNGVPEVMDRVRSERTLSQWFDAVIVSYEIGCTKPDARIYEATLSALGVPAAAALFVDDRMTNIAAAEQLGLQVLHFTDDSSVEKLKTRVFGAGLT